MKKLLILTSLILTLSACNSSIEKQESPAAENMEHSATQETTATTSAENKMQENKSYTLTEIAKHSTKDDCWFAIEDKVYDATPFIASQKHPGGAAILEGCGKDATELFNTRPMGSGTPHSDNARDNLSNFYIGDLAK